MKVALITGGSRGIGRAMVEEFAAAGYAVGFTYAASVAAAEALTSSVAEKGGRALPFRADVRDFARAQKVGEEIRAALGPIDVLINNAGIRRDRALANMDPELWREVIETNLNGTFHYARACVGGEMLRDLEIPTKWVKMDPVDQYHFPGLPPFAVPADFEKYLEKLREWFPHETAAIDTYFVESRKAYLYGLLLYFRGVANDHAERFETYTVTEKLDEHFHDPRLKAILMADCPHWGSLPSRTSYLFNAMLRMSYFLGNYYPLGGSQQFADDLGNAFHARGGRILKCAQVESILIENGKAQGVRIRALSRRRPADYTFRAPVVVSNADALHTYRDLIGEERCGRGPIEHLESLTPTYPCFLLHIGLRGMDPEQLARSEGYYWSSFDPDDAIRNVFKIFIPTHFAPGVAPPGCQILIVQKLTPLRLEQVTDWDAHKTAIEEQIMARLREIPPGIDEHIVCKSSASAFTSFRYTNNWQGAMLGWAMSPEQLGEARLPAATPVENLYLTGHWTRPGGGVTPVIVSAQRLAQSILTGRSEGLGDTEEYFALGAASSEAGLKSQIWNFTRRASQKAKCKRQR